MKSLLKFRLETARFKRSKHVAQYSGRDRRTRSRVRAIKGRVA